MKLPILFTAMASTSGKINTAREPILTVRLATDVTFPCVVDTGFTGALMLPREIIERSNVPIIGKETFQRLGTFYHREPRAHPDRLVGAATTRSRGD